MNPRGAGLRSNDTCAKYSMVWGFSGFIDRNQSLNARCFVVSFFINLATSMPKLTCHLKNQRNPFLVIQPFTEKNKKMFYSLLNHN
jgi:hypothetical protein